MTSGGQKTDFNYIDDVVNGLIDATNFKIKDKNFLKFGICALENNVSKAVAQKFGIG